MLSAAARWSGTRPWSWNTRARSRSVQTRTRTPISSNRLLPPLLLLLSAFTLAPPATAQTQGFDSFRRETARALTSKRVEDGSTAKRAQLESRSSRRAQIDTDLHFTSRTDS